MPLLRLAIVLLLALHALAQAQPLNKCTDAAGKVVYQSTTCDSGAKQASVKTDRPQYVPPSKRGLKAPPLTTGERKLLSDAELRAAENRREVIPGMEQDAVTRMFGNPDKINATDVGRGKREQWIYYEKDRYGREVRLGNTTYIYVVNEKVESYQASRR